MSPAPRFRVVAPDTGYLEVVTPIVRRFLGMPDDEPTELTFFAGKSIFVAHALDAENHVRLLQEGKNLRGFTGAYMLHAPIDRRVLARYEPNVIHRVLDRVSDKEVTARRSAFIDIDVDRPKGISSTDDELKESCDVADRIESYLAQGLGGDGAIGRGCSGNGYFLLIALESRPVESTDNARISKFLDLLNRKFGIPGRIKIDKSVFNPARLMPSPGTWKRKGANTAERPWRRTSFCCRANVKRARLEDL